MSQPRPPRRFDERDRVQREDEADLVYRDSRPLGDLIVNSQHPQGRENVRAFLKENKDVFARVDTELRKKLGIAGASSAVAEVPPVPTDGPAQAKEVVRSKK